ncbi:MAG TPA: PAS domain S-box protein [Burkholderiales bacterium]
MSATATALHEPRDAELRALLELAPDGIFVADVEGRYTFVNEVGCRLLGYARDELVGRRIMDLLPYEDVGRLLESREQMLQGATHVAEWRLQRKDGSWVPVEVSAKIDARGHWQGFVRDISERKAHEAERDTLLRETESERRWLQTVVDTLPLGIVLYRPDGQIFFNSRTEELLGMTLSAAAGREQYAERIRFPNGSMVPVEEQPLARIVRDGETIIAEEYCVERPDGTRVPVLASGAPIRGDNGHVVGAVGLFQDVSERTRMAESIRQHARLLQGIFDILPVGVWIADARGRIVANNPAAERIWRGARYVPVAQFGQYKGWWAESGKPIAAEEWALARALVNGETSTGELVRIQCFDGSYKTIINSAAPLRDEKGAITGAIVANEDVTSLQHAQEQLRTAVHDREQILAIVTHDLRSPLSGLMMSAAGIEHIARSLPGGEPVSELAAALMDTTRRMSGMVDDLLAIAVATTGGASMMRFAPVSASALIARAVDSARPLLAKESLDLQLEVSGELPLIHADAERILRVFANLFDNALKYTSPPGCITLAAEESTGGVRFSVANSGPALQDKELEAMFRPFWQAGRDRRGAGLGLGICRSIIEAHGGSIWAEPAEGQRVRISFFLPRRPGATSA